MSAPLIIAIDAMGGDHGPEVTIPGAARAMDDAPGVSFIFFGDQARIDAALAREPRLAGARVVHTATVVAMDDKPSQALRRGKGTSMWLALDAVAKGDASVAVSAGNTGALMAMARLILRPMPGIERPAIAAIWPTTKEPCIVLDVGANIGAEARQLVDYALMGAAMSRALFRFERPRVGLLNVGVEEIKGAEEVKQAHQWLKQGALPLDYIGFVEGDRMGHGDADVVVVEGFAGNIALKTAEGTAKQVSVYLKEAMTSSLVTKIGAWLARAGFQQLRWRMDPRRLNGGTFLGLNGIVIKSHGGTDAIGFASAVGVGYKMGRAGLLKPLEAEVAQFHGSLATLSAMQ
jgi:glycerol-3-phosphate acyltransferase PlsX